jgi:hypothetical protein
MHVTFYSENLMGRDILGNPGIDGRVLLKEIFKK